MLCVMYKGVLQLTHTPVTIAPGLGSNVTLDMPPFFNYFLI